MTHNVSKSDRVFLHEVESGRYPVSRFDHRAHLRLAYIFLVENDVDTASELTRRSILDLLDRNGIDSSKFHVTITRAWILAVNHFMHTVKPADSSNEFIDSLPEMLDSKIMMTHYSEEKLFSSRARREFVPPDLAPIPRYGA